MRDDSVVPDLLPRGAQATHELSSRRGLMVPLSSSATFPPFSDLPELPKLNFRQPG